MPVMRTAPGFSPSFKNVKYFALILKQGKLTVGILSTLAPALCSLSVKLRPNERTLMKILSMYAVSFGLLVSLTFANAMSAQTFAAPGEAPANSTAQTGAKPAAAKPAPLEVPQLKFEKYKLENGLEVILSEDHRLPMVAVNLWYHVGPANELPGRTGFAHLFEHRMFEGSRNGPGRSHFPHLEGACESDSKGQTTLG